MMSSIRKFSFFFALPFLWWGGFSASGPQSNPTASGPDLEFIPVAVHASQTANYHVDQLQFSIAPIEEEIIDEAQQDQGHVAPPEWAAQPAVPAAEHDRDHAPNNARPAIPPSDPGQGNQPTDPGNGNPDPGTPPDNSNGGDNGNPDPGTPPDNSNGGDNGNPDPGTPPDNSNGGDHGNPDPGTPPDNSNGGDHGNPDPGTPPDNSNGGDHGNPDPGITSTNPGKPGGHSNQGKGNNSVFIRFDYR